MKPQAVTLEEPTGRAIPRAVSIRDWLAAQFREVRARTSALAAPLTPEDQVIQVAWFASPTKWHLAHTTWFFETFLLAPHFPGYRPFHPAYRDFFNSYYNTVGDPIAQGVRGYYSRPTVQEVSAYRRHVDDHFLAMLMELPEDRPCELRPLIELGLHHEQQHQELLITDIKFALAQNPLLPVYRELPVAGRLQSGDMNWQSYPGGLQEIGHAGDGFCFDNETPRHRVFLRPFELGSRLVTNGEYLEFMEESGYRRAELWLALGWKQVQQQGWAHPLYWFRREGRWWTYTLNGVKELNEQEPVCHVSFFEADAFARWAGARLPGEAEWESVAAQTGMEGNFLEQDHLHPRVNVSEAATAGAALSKPGSRCHQMFGDVWEWTASPYVAYPGFRSSPGALGEYNGKFMCNQMVLRGGSCATPCRHIRPSYRNFFPPELRWQFMGIRLARDGG